ncbi:A disintegrin and metalloproteinase with thrombospondin motifs 12-like isoform X2 [Euwallacea fornicatus]|uniref:A disintegrin and metalloproteinase with thrombospondin motifs 12-like isoform X2 n=1 Tax=Euwallacea fornicatus TaxID=995702 RepID=UPI00338E4808
MPLKVHFHRTKEGYLLVLHETLLLKAQEVIHGKYTENIKNFHLAVPHKATPDGEFATFHLEHSHAYNPEEFRKRRKRELDDPDSVHYGIMLDNEMYHLELWPDRNLVHPQAIFEKRDPTLPVRERDVKGVENKKMCYYWGRVRGVPNSKVALSACDGLAGTVSMKKKMYHIEPVAGHSPNKKGHHLHVVHQAEKSRGNRYCAVDDSQENWTNAIKRRITEEYAKGNNIFRREAEFQSANESRMEIFPQWIEIMLVTDKKMVLRHTGKRDIEQWILTLFSQVRMMFADASMWAVIQPTLVRIVYLEKEEQEIDLQVQQDVDKTLHSFCTWARKLQPKEESHPNHFDVAVLIWDFCRTKGTECGIVGWAFVGEACSQKSNCMVTEDGGLIDTITTITHELGHLLGMTHDADENPCPGDDPSDGSSYVMNAYSKGYTIRWSPCSIASMKQLASIHLLDCFNDEPEFEVYPLGDNLPGVVYDQDTQCKVSLREKGGITGGCKASSDPDKQCQQLGCIRANKKCVAFYGQRMADGTACGTDKWCINKKCVPKGTRPEGIDGGWGEWGEWSPCTKNCSRGTQFQERLCDNPKPVYPGKGCTGPIRMIRICNPQDCPLDAIPFRLQQCHKYMIDYSAKYIEGHFSKEQPCIVKCYTQNKKTDKKQIINLRRPIDDGAKCEVGNPLKMCVAGRCVEVGCDNKLIGSEAVMDHCGICNGDGTRCKTVNGEAVVNGEGYQKLTVVPAGSRSFKLREMTPSENYIVLGLPDRKIFYFNEGAKNAPGIYPLGEKKRGYFMYKLNIYNQTNRDFDIEFISWDLNREDIGVYALRKSNTKDNITWTFVEPSETPIFDPKYKWDIAEYKECSKMCDGGVQEARLACYEKTAGRVSDFYCEKLEKPKEQEPKKCNTQPCPKEWKVGVWGRCRACKNKSGVRMREVQCVKKNSNPKGDDIILEDSECKEIKPGIAELCTSNRKCDSSRRKKSISIPRKFQDSIWKQMSKRHVIENRGTLKHPSIYLNGKKPPPCTNATTAFTWRPSTIHIGQIVVDKGEDAAGVGDIVVQDITEVEVDSSVQEDDLEEAEDPALIIQGTTKLMKALDFERQFDTPEKYDEPERKTTKDSKVGGNCISTKFGTEVKWMPVKQTND